MKKTKKIVQVTISSILGAVLLALLSILVVNTIALSKNEIASFFGYSMTYVPSNSMEPTIEAGDTVLIKKCDFDDIKVGDIIVYNDGDRYIIHTVVRITDEGFLKCQGDNRYTNPVEDKLDIDENMVFGKYVRTVNFLSFASIFRNNNYVFPLCIIVFGAILASELVSFKRTLDKKREKALLKEKQDLEAMKEEALKQELLEELKRELTENKKD